MSTSIRCRSSSVLTSRSAHSFDLNENSTPRIPKRPDSASVRPNEASAKISAVRLVTKDLIRDLVIPRPEGSSYLMAVISPEKFSNLKKSALVLTEEEKKASFRKRIKEKDELQLASRLRREKFEQLDSVPKHNEKLDVLAEDAKQKTEYLCKKANDYKQEQEQEIKEINELILCAKVQAIRDSQVAEKKLIQNEYKKVELDLDALMEKKRIQGLQQENEKACSRREKAFRACQEIKHQIQQNEEGKLLELERKEREGEEVIKRVQLYQFQNLVKKKESKIKQKELLKSLVKENEVVRKRKEYEKAQTQTQDQWIAEYQRQKAAKEAAAEIEIKEKKLLRDIEIEKLREVHDRESQLLSQKDALRFRRSLESKEREWREKEKLRVKKERDIQDGLKKSRSQQLKLQDHLRVLRAENDQKDYETLLDKSKYEIKLEELHKESKRKQNLKYANEVRKQIEEKEKERVIERKEVFKEGALLQQQEKRRNDLIDGLRRQKLDKLKEYDVPEIYLKHVERKVQLPANS